jgi:hypothetical protein
LTAIESALGPLIEIKGDRIILRGWRNVSLLNLAAVLLPIIAGLFAFVGGGAWRVIAFMLFAFSTYGIWAIYRGTFATIGLSDDEVIIDRKRLKRSEILKFDGRRAHDPSNMDDTQSSAELWVILRGGAEIPIIKLSGAAPIEEAAAYLTGRIGRR